MQGLEPGPPIESPLRLAEGQTRMLYFFTELRGASGRPVVHQWERNGRVVQRSELRTGSQSWRTYSGMAITAAMPGKWRVAVIDARTGAVMGETRFRVE
jgi:hypothetical protein